MLPYTLNSLNKRPETKKPLNTKNKSTPIQPIFSVNWQIYRCLSKTNTIAIPRKKSSSLSLFNLIV